MASMVNFVVNKYNQLPTYCYAEESLIAESCSKSTITEELEEVPLTSSGLNATTHHDNNQQQSLLRPPPGFVSFGEHSSVPSTPTDGPLGDIYSTSLGNASSTKASPLVLGDATNPFLDSWNLLSQFAQTDSIFNEPARRIYMQISQENLQLQITLLEMFHDMLKRSPMSKCTFENYFALQLQFNKILKTFMQMVMVTDDEQSSAAASVPSHNGAASDAPKTPLSSESFANQEIGNSTAHVSGSAVNPFGDLPHDRRPNYYAATAFSTAGGGPSDLVYQNGAHDITAQSAYHVNTNWGQTDDLKLRIQVPPSSAPPIFNSYGNAAGIPVLPCTGLNEHAPSMLPGAPSTDTANIDLSGFLRNATNSDFVNMPHLQRKSEDPSAIRETNPFKLSLAGKIQIQSGMRSERANGHDGGVSMSYLPGGSMQNHVSQMQSANVVYATYTNPARNELRRDFVVPTTANNVNVNGGDGYAPRIVYEAGPVMYNTQQQQQQQDAGKAIAKQASGSYNCDRESAQNASLRLGQCEQKGQELSAQSANGVVDTNKPHFVSPSALTDVFALNDEGYVTPHQSSLSSLKSEPNYYHHQQQQQGVNANEQLRGSMDAWIGAKFQNVVALHDHSTNSVCSSTMSKPTGLLPTHKEWCNSDREAPVAQIPNGTADPNHVLQSDRNNNERATYVSSWNPFPIEGQRSTDHRSASSYNCNMSLNNCFLFHRIGMCDIVEYSVRTFSFFRRRVDARLINQRRSLPSLVDSVKGITIIFHIEDNGWMLAHEFAEVFTNFKSCSYLMSTLEAINMTVTFKEIQRSDYPAQFLQLDR